MKGLALHWQIVIALVLGAAAGAAIDEAARAGYVSTDTVATVAAVGQGIGKLFLSLLGMLVVPLVLSSIVSGIVSVPDLRGLRRLSLWTFGYYLVTSALAIATGLVLVNLIQPGRGLKYADLYAASATSGGQPAPESQEATLSSLWDVLFRMVPDNVVAVATDNKLILGVIFFAILLGVFIKKTGGEHGELMGRFFSALFAVMMRMTTWVVSLAPIGVLAIVTAIAASGGLRIAGDLLYYMVTVALGLVIHATVTLPLIVWLLARRSPIAYARAVAPALLTAFSTASSNATLPLTLRCVEERGRISNRVGSFTLPLGATVNMDGTALYEAVAVLFIAQTITDLTLVQQITVAVTALLASIGAAGIPHAGTVMMVVVLGAVGLPSEAVIVILAVDRVLDMMRTTVNVWSDCCGAAVVARQAGLDRDG